MLVGSPQRSARKEVREHTRRDSLHLMLCADPAGCCRDCIRLSLLLVSCKEQPAQYLSSWNSCGVSCGWFCHVRPSAVACRCVSMCRRYVHIYQQKLDALQPKAAPPADIPASDTSASDWLDGGAAAATQPQVGDADSSLSEGSTALQLELQRLEQHLCVEDILLCRSLAELALERRSSSSGKEVLGCRTVLGATRRLLCLQQQLVM